MKLEALGVPLVRASFRLSGQVELVGLLQRPVGEVDEIRRSVSEKGVDVLVEADVGVAVDDGVAVLAGKTSEIYPNAAIEGGMGLRRKKDGNGIPGDPSCHNR